MDKSVHESNESISTKKRMSPEAIFYEGTMFVKEDLEKSNYLAEPIDDDFMSMPQLIAVKNEVKTLVFVNISDTEAFPKSVFSNEQISEFMRFSSDRQADCLVAIVCIKNPEGGTDLYYGDGNSYTVKYDLFPSLTV
ncbi:hypothetical protein [Emticicia sp.]|uniref:hypothetical protein n=1 Tax=Emticicia sp. TaxID=1930953 RepID=UPI0037506C7E